MLKLIACCLALICLFPALVQAVPVTITNPGFESNIAAPGATSSAVGWTLSGPGGGGVWNYSTTGTTYFDVPAPDGAQVGFLSIGPAPGAAATFEQTVGTISADTLYTLTGLAGHPKTSTFGVGTIYTAELLANGTTVLASFSNAGPVGNYEQFTTTFSSAGTPFVGNSLSIRLSSNKAQTEFDTIALDASPVPPVPEPGSLALSGMGLLGALSLRRKRNNRRQTSGQ